MYYNLNFLHLKWLSKILILSEEQKVCCNMGESYNLLLNMFCKVGNLNITNHIHTYN